MTLRIVRLCLAAALAATTARLYAQTLPARPPRSAASFRPNHSSADLNDYNIQGADVDAVLGTLEDLTGRTVIRPAALPPATYTIKLTQVSKSDMVIALETLLEKNLVAVIPLGDRFLEVVPLQLARTEAPEFIEGSTLGMAPSGRIATKLFQFKFLRVAEFFNPALINGMFSPNLGGSVVVVEKVNAALVTDTIANLQRTEQLIATVDKPSAPNLTPKFYTLHNGAKASDMISKIHALLTGPIQNEIGSTTVYNADDRTNQIIVLCAPEERSFFDNLIEKLDVKSDTNTRIEVITLKHADATVLVTTLSTLISTQAAAVQKAAGAPSVRPNESTTGNAGASFTLTPAFPQPPAAGQTPGGLPAAPTVAVNTAAGIPGTQGATSNVFSSFMSVVPDERSNSVVVSGTIDDIRLIHDLIDKLDTALAQVRIEVIIAEVTLTDTDQSGISALNLTVGTAGNHGTHITNFTGGVAGWDVSSGVVNPLAFAAALNPSSAGSKNLVHILSAPVIVTAHNKAAEVTVGEEIPVITGSQSSLASTGTTPVSTSTFNYQKVAIDLTVTPLIGDNGDVQLTIDQKVDDILSYTTIDGNATPNIGDREAKSFITVKDGQMIVLGGLQRTTKTENHNKIGFIFEIPIISQLLGGHTDTLDRTELLFFIRPHVITPEDSTGDTQKRIDELSNKKQINNFLQDPGNQPESKVKNLLDRFKN